MSVWRYLLILGLGLVVQACGGGDGNITPDSVTMAGKVANSSGNFVQPNNNEIFKQNLLFAVRAKDVDGIKAVYLQLGQSQQFVYLCQDQQDCGGNEYNGTITGVNPKKFGVNRGTILVSLWVLDVDDMAVQVAQLSVNWQPPQIAGISAVRNATGDSVSINWTLDPSILRYNLYLAEQTGVNRDNYQQLLGGTALLSVATSPQQFSSLDPAKVYYLLVVGVDGSGESTYASEVQIPLNSGIANTPPVAQDDSYTGVTNTNLIINPQSGLLNNDNDPDGDPMSIDVVAVQLPASGQLNLQTDGSFEYIPNTGFVGSDSFVYQLMDDKGGSAQANVDIEIKAIPADLSGESSSINSELLYLGLGENSPGSNIGTGNYRIGSCVQDQDTRCTMVGRYTEGGLSGHNANGGGQYAFMLSYSGIGVSPVVAQSQSAGSVILSFVQLGDAVFDLTLFPDEGGILHGVFPDTPFSQSIGFSPFIKPQEVCQGLAVGDNCNIGRVGQVAGSSLTAPLDRLSFSIPGSVWAGSVNSAPQAAVDQYQVITDQTLNIAALGLLANDSDPDTALVGDELVVRNPLSLGLGQLVGIGVDEYRQALYLYPAFSNDIRIFDRLGNGTESFALPGEIANDFDIDIAPSTFQLGGTFIPQGTVLAIDGETGVAEIYAIDPATGTLLAQLATDFGADHVVGGTYNAVTGTFFLIQDSVPGAEGNKIAKIDPKTGAVLSSFSTGTFNVSYGDIESNSHTGNLYLVSNVETAIAEFNPDGILLRHIALPAAVTNSSGIAISESGDRLWIANTQGNVYELQFDNAGKLPELIASLLTAPTNGTVTVLADGSFTYTPNAGFTGQDSFVYQINDQQGGTSQALVTLNVQ